MQECFSCGMLPWACTCMPWCNKHNREGIYPGWCSSCHQEHKELEAKRVMLKSFIDSWYVRIFRLFGA